MDYFDMEQESRLFPWIDDEIEVQEPVEYDEYDDVGDYDIYSNDWEG